MASMRVVLSIPLFDLSTGARFSRTAVDCADIIRKIQ